MSNLGYIEFYPDDVIDDLNEIDDELEYTTPKARSYMLLWLREKSHRAKIKGSANDFPLYKGAELANNMTGPIREDTFKQFDDSYMDYLYRQIKLTKCSDESRQALVEYLNEKKTLAEISILSEHLEEDEMINTILKVLREEPRNEWYEALIDACEESIVLQKYYASIFGVTENEVFPVTGDYNPQNGEIFYMSLAEGVEPEAVLFIKKIHDRKADKELSVFCHLTSNGDLEYFTISNEEGKYVPISRNAGNESNMERLALWAKNAMDFSDDVYLVKPTMEEITERIEKENPTSEQRFEAEIKKLFYKMQETKQWSFGKGVQGEAIAKAPAFAKLKAFRLMMMHFENYGNYSLPKQSLIEEMQNEAKVQQEFTEQVFVAMRNYLAVEMKQEYQPEKGATMERETSKLKVSDDRPKVPVER